MPPIPIQMPPMRWTPMRIPTAPEGEMLMAYEMEYIMMVTFIEDNKPLIVFLLVLAQWLSIGFLLRYIWLFELDHVLLSLIFDYYTGLFM